MVDLARERCFHHASREAVARCLSCRRSFCRECVTEHQDRVLCASCLRNLSEKEQDRVPRFRIPFQILHLICGFAFVWFSFYLLGRALLLLPSSFHEGTLWKIEDLDP